MAGGKLTEEGIELVGMWVDPNFRKIGIGKNLVEKIEKELPHSNYLLWVNSVNSNAVQFYESIGYNKTGITEPLEGRPHITELKMIKD